MLKAFFLLLLVAFGAAMFTAGALAPSSVKAPLERLAMQAAALLPGAHPHAAAAPSTATAVAGGAVIATSAAAPAPAYAASTPIASLLVPAPPPAHGHYALQAATFTSSDAASLFAGSVSEQGFKATIVPITDSGQPLIVAVGDYPSPEAASADQLVVGRQLKSTALPPVVLLPPAPPAH
ncbi:SPOR domain-containing protein [Paraburkholderia sediminicola]|uniref:SPOR domain-containing protein n=1 Tax=Paraburkholderia TaxID=1822464 RepID=UPI0038B97B42